MTRSADPPESGPRELVALLESRVALIKLEGQAVAALVASLEEQLKVVETLLGLRDQEVKSLLNCALESASRMFKTARDPPDEPA